MLTVFGRKTSSNVQALLWCLDELQLKYTRLDYGHKFGGVDTAEFRQMNPHGLVPVLVHDAHPAIFETGAILRYVAAIFAKSPFWPADPIARAQVDKWAEWAKISVALKFTGPVFWARVRTKPSLQNSKTLKSAVTLLEQQLATADRELATRAFLAGPEFTLADIQMGHVLYRYYDIDITRADLPNLRAYYDRLTQRPAYRAHVMTSYEDLRVTE